MNTLIFDFDGTIADSFEAFLEIFDEILNRPQKLTPQEVTELRGKSLAQIIKYLKIRRWQLPKLILRGKKLVGQRIDTIKPFSGIPQVLKQLNKDGKQMFILSTNSPDNISRFLNAHDLDGCFAKIYGDIGLRSKTSVIKKIIKKQSLLRSDCSYIGDEIRDIQAAKKAGLTSVAVAWGFNSPNSLVQAKPTALAKTPKELLKILG